MPKLLSVSTVVASLALASLRAAAGEATAPVGDWPCWRGPTHDNHSRSERPPLHWSKDSGIAWRVAVPGRGHASPCVSGGRIFIASADETEHVQFLICLDQQTGDQRWRTDLHSGPLPTIHAKNSHASATPACDGQHVYTAFVHSDQLWLSAVDVDGKIVWQKLVGAYKHANGFGASPLLFERLVIVASDNTAEPTVAAFDRDDGHEVWRATRPSSDNSATPVVAHVGGRPQLLINGAGLVSSLDPATGDELWRVIHKTEVAACTMAFDDDCVFASGNVPEPNLLAVRATGQGDVSDSQVVWHTDNSITYVPSPLAVVDHLFTVIDSGVAIVYEKATGRVAWKRRLGGNFTSSPVLANGNVYATNEDGTTFVFAAADSFKKIAENKLEELCLATPAICGDRAYLRTAEHLYCIEGDENN